MGRKNFNTTIDESTIELIDELAVGRSKGEVIDAAVKLLAADKPRHSMGDIVTRLDKLRDGLYAVSDNVNEIVEAVRRKRNGDSPVTTSFDPATIPGVSQGAPKDLPKNADCGHCGKRFAGAKRATLCPDCRDAGHGGDRVGCEKCSEGMGA